MPEITAKGSTQRSPVGSGVVLARISQREGDAARPRCAPFPSWEGMPWVPATWPCR